jgi:small subunit ribosomal protein S11
MGKKKVVQKAEDASGAEEKGKAASGSAKSSSKKIENGFVYVNATYNNTVVTVTDAAGNVVAWSSAGSLGFSGPKKATPFAASKVVATVIEKIKKTGPFVINVVVKGVGSGRDSAVRTFAGTQGFVITSIKDATPIPHNGPRPPKVRRV